MTRGRLIAIAVGVAIVFGLALRYLVWIDPSTRCIVALRPSLVGYDNMTVKRALEGRPPGHDLESECYREDDRILRALVRFE